MCFCGSRLIAITPEPTNERNRRRGGSRRAPAGLGRGCRARKPLTTYWCADPPAPAPLPAALVILRAPWGSRCARLARARLGPTDTCAKQLVFSPSECELQGRFDLPTHCLIADARRPRQRNPACNRADHRTQLHSVRGGARGGAVEWPDRRTENARVCSWLGSPRDG